MALMKNPLILRNKDLGFNVLVLKELTPITYWCRVLTPPIKSWFIDAPCFKPGIEKEWMRNLFEPCDLFSNYIK
jgi:hypothetical protein